MKDIIAKIRRKLGIGSLPGYLIIGTQKGGTSSLQQQYLTQHPDVLRPTTKEVHYFDLNFERGSKWYRSHFPVGALVGNKITGEATPYYLYHPLVPERTHQLLPDVKIIVVLRDPVSRAFSHYNMSVRQKNETEDFEEAIELEEARINNKEKKLTLGEISYSSEHQFHSYIARGRYAQQLERWFKYYPREQFLITTSDRLKAEPEQVASEIFEFLGLKPYRIDKGRKRNVGEYKSKLDPKIKNKLHEYFAPHNKRLEELIQKKLNWD
ncbi:MAG: sulfotransferase domain-containing protein [Candidatus Dojkabacteria bacterium]